MNTKRLAAAIRQNASDLRDLREASTLLRVLAHVVDGMPLAKAFGSPGDWGYHTPIGQAIAAAPEPPSSDASVTGADECTLYLNL
ncbi:hypothetical protein [Accumulibacter sp.]|uniref:hypothetical protein n=1 Tax=Accumulibacter sp. TaxID=2053492 RepID=UPI002609BA2F|nr:hypothetical protein [Accumulibacter sp.]HRD68290.1 hypothetical protein [Candidatus Competibacter sp.]